MFSKPSDPTVTDQDLHAFVDGELDGRRYKQVVQRLAADPYASERVSAILRQQGGFALLREHLADVDASDDEQAKDLARRLAGAVRHQRRVRVTSVASALALSLLVGSLSVWGPEPGTMARRLASLGAAQDRPQVLFGRDQPDAGQLAAAANGAGASAAVFDQQLEAYAVRRPDLAAHGLTFAGGDMLKGGRSPAVRLVYEDATARRVFLYIGTVGDEDDVALTLVPEGHISLNWRRGPLVFVLIGPKESEELLEVMRSTSDFLVPVPNLRPEPQPATPDTETVLAPPDGVTPTLAPSDPAQPATETLLPGAATQAPLPADPGTVPDTTPKTL